MTRFTAIIIGLSIFGSLYGGAYIDNRLAARPARIALPMPVKAIVMEHLTPHTSIYMPDPVSRQPISYDLRGRKLVKLHKLIHVASVDAACEHIRGCKQ